MNSVNYVRVKLGSNHSLVYGRKMKTRKRCNLFHIRYLEVPNDHDLLALTITTRTVLLQATVPRERSIAGEERHHLNEPLACL
jgi:hypothetical protein